MWCELLFLMRKNGGVKRYKKKSLKKKKSQTEEHTNVLFLYFIFWGGDYCRVDPTNRGFLPACFRFKCLLKRNSELPWAYGILPSRVAGNPLRLALARPSDSLRLPCCASCSLPVLA